MEISDKRIDGGRSFDWGRTSADYARFRDIYPPEFYAAITELGLCINGQRVLDVGTGTGVLPRNLYAAGAEWTAADASAEQLAQAAQLSKGMDIRYIALPAEKLAFAPQSFDVITACQCFWYFRHERTAPLFHELLKPGGTLLVLEMNWLPEDDPVAGASEALVLKYDPDWTGNGKTMQPTDIPASYAPYFDRTYHREWKLPVHFTRESWHGRMRACRGVGASLALDALAQWEWEHWAMLERIAPPEFDVLHYAAITELRRK